MQVWEAKKDGAPERVVVKVINDKYRNDREQLYHLKHEYEVGKDLKHPNVIRMRELQTVGATAYLVMEYFDAPNLKQVLWQGTGHWDQLLDERAAISGRLVITEAAQALITAARTA